MSMDDAESGVVALVENLQRQDLDFIEEALGISKLIQLQNLSQEQAARMIGKSQSAVANKLRLLKHSPKVLEALRAGELTERHARALLRLPSEPQKLRAIETIVKLGMSVARTERYVDELLGGADAERSARVDLKGFLNHLGKSLTIETIVKLGMSVARTERYVDELLGGADAERSARVDLKGFLNHLGKSLTRIQSSGIPAVSERRETEDEIVLTITIPKMQSKHLSTGIAPSVDNFSETGKQETGPEVALI